MNDFLKIGLSLVAGIAIGAIGATAVSRSKLEFKPVCADLVSRGMDIKDAIMGKVEAIKEDAEDMLAAARQKAEVRKAEQGPAANS